VSAGKQRIGPSKRCALSRFSSETRRSGGLAAAQLTFRRKRQRPSRSAGIQGRAGLPAGLRSVAARWPSPLPSCRSPFPARLQGLPDRGMPARFRADIRPLAFTSRSARPKQSGKARTPTGARERTSAGARTFLSSSDSILRSPLLQHPRGGPLPGRRQPSSRSCLATFRPFGPWLPRHDIAFRPRGFAPPRRFSPRRGCRACCIPVPDMGFAAFLDRQATTAEAVAAGGRAVRLPKEDGTRPGSSQRQPSEGLILAGSRAASLRPMPSCRSSEPPTTASRDACASNVTVEVSGRRVSDGPPADAASRPFPPDAARRGDTLRRPPVEGPDEAEAPPRRSSWM